MKEIKEFGAWSEQTSSSGRKYFYNRDTEVSQWEKPKEWRDYEARIAEQERLAAEQERIQQQVHVQQQQQHAVVPPPPMFITPPPFAFPPPFAPPGFPVGPMNAPPPPFPPYNQFQPPPNIPYPIPPRISSTISGPINTSFVTFRIFSQHFLLKYGPIAPSPHVNTHFSPLHYSAPPPTTGVPPPLHNINQPIPAPPPTFTSVPSSCTPTPNRDSQVPHLTSGRVLQSPQTLQQQQNHVHSQFSRDRVPVEKSPRATPPSTRHNAPPPNVQQLAVPPISPSANKKEFREKHNEEQDDRLSPNRTYSNAGTPTRTGAVKRERTDSETNQEQTSVEVEDEKPLTKKTKEEDTATSWRSFYNADLARQKQIELNLEVDPEMRELLAQSLTLENKLVAKLIKMKTAAALVAVQENEACICNAKIQSLRDLRHELELRQSRLMAPAVVTMPDLNSRA
ncbi:WW domain protein [Dictyocaulus viviparus]|uniref:WW domain protein n=1 Tax=Dictyocaulus viviparus TaxID=29172 RepID=A0A0D8XXV6_DICVI|nr:WW domain protein [Dictyocaulus viviparus]